MENDVVSLTELIKSDLNKYLKYYQEGVYDSLPIYAFKNDLNKLKKLDNERYLELSSFVVRHIISVLVEQWKIISKAFNSTRDSSGRPHPDFTSKLGKLEFNNKLILKELKQFELNEVDNQLIDGLEKYFENPYKKSGCYIATMAYGDYNHPQVLVLRQFRDKTLKNYLIGKWFIKTYYHYSPKLVEKLKNKKVINTIIRKTLNQFIKLIRL